MDRFPLAFTVVAGALLLASPLYVLPHAASPTYRHAVQTADPGGGDVAYTALSPDARETLDAARSGDGVVVVRTDDPAFDPGVTAVTDGERRYLVRTVAEPPSTALRWLRQSLTTFGAVLLGVSGVALRTDDPSPALPVGFAAVGVGTVTAAVAGVGPVEGAGLLVVAVTAQFAALWWAVAAATGRLVPRPFADE